MFNWLRARLLPFLRVPAEPEPPFGAPGSVRIFRAAPNFYRLRLLVWSVGQIATLVGIVISLTFLTRIKNEADDIRSERQAALAAADPTSSDASASQRIAPAEPKRPAHKKPLRQVFWHDPHNPVGRLIDRSPWWLFSLIGLIEFVGIVGYLVQLPLTYALVRLEFESHWYIVTDRSLRIRSGLVTVRESTMSFANLQQVTVSQGPLQQLLRLADVRVQSAGGGGDSGGEHGEGEKDSMHTGVFHGVNNAGEIRDLILARLQHFRAAGLGDPEEPTESSAVAGNIEEGVLPIDDVTADGLAAARAALEEARALRRAVTQRG